MTRDPKCPFCGLHPYEYVDIGIGQQAVAVNCCEGGYLLFDGGEKYGHLGMSMRRVVWLKRWSSLMELFYSLRTSIRELFEREEPWKPMP